MSTMFFNVDVETSGLTPATGQLLTVGIAPLLHDANPVVLSKDNFYMRIEREESLRAQGWYDVDPPNSTATWWREQSAEARAEAYEDRTLYRASPIAAARTIETYVKFTLLKYECSEAYFVANPVSFDKMWLTALFDETGVKDPFHYRSLCLRSMAFGLAPGSSWGDSVRTNEPRIPHHALDDATAQAYDLMNLLNKRDV